MSEGIRLRADSDGSTKNAFYQGTIVSGTVQQVATRRRPSSLLLPPRGDPRRQQQQGRKRTNQGGRNNSHNSKQKPVSMTQQHQQRESLSSSSSSSISFSPYKKVSGSSYNSINNGNYFSPPPNSGDGRGSFVARHTSTDTWNSPNMVGSLSVNSANDVTNDVYGLVSPESASSVGAARGGEGEITGGDMLFDSSGVGRGVEAWQKQDSLRYSVRSTMSDMSQSLVGTSLLNDDDTALRTVTMTGSQSTVESFISEGDALISSQILQVVSSQAVNALSADENTSSRVDDESSIELADDRRSSVRSFGSGIYFNPPGPSGPVMSGVRTSLSSNQYPIQQANPSGSYGSLTTLRKERNFVSRNRRSPAPTIEEDGEESTNTSDESVHWTHKIRAAVDLTAWLSRDILLDEDGVPYFDDSSRWTVAGIVRWLVYNPLHPEFTSLHQFSWAVLIGAFMGGFTAGWKLLTEKCVTFTWQTLPRKLLEWGVFTSLDGAFPLYHYMWIVPSLLGGILSLVTVLLPTPIPTQNDWIHALHYRGVQEAGSFISTFIMATLGMMSGLSLGPELPLVLTAGMIGSWVGLLCHQSMLSARVMNLTAASAAIGGFFGFPMAGALFVLELPHEMGLQYFEALSPASIASIVAVLINRIVINNDVTGMFRYPFLNESLPSYIFKDAVVYGVFGGALGSFYVFGVKSIKSWVHDIFDHCAAKENVEDLVVDESQEATPLVGRASAVQKRTKARQKHGVSRHLMCRLIPNKLVRVALTGTLAGAAVGVTGMFLPHVMFWGEAQLQTMIDKGRTPLPIFGQGDEPTAAMASLGYCIVDRSNGLGFDLVCSFAIVVAKIFVTGVSLATGIVGGHFWAPLLVGSAASHFLTDSMKILSDWIGYSVSLSAYPCVALLCTMGATHVVTFRAHMAIILILTLSIDAFVPEDGMFSDIKVAGDYAAVFPLLTVAVFVALHLSREIVFYEKKRCRGDIMVVPQALCQPGKEGRPLVMDYEGKLHELDESDYEYETDSDLEASASSCDDVLNIPTALSQDDIEANFLSTQMMNRSSSLAFRQPNSILKVDNSQKVSFRRAVSPLSQKPSHTEPPPPLPPVAIRVDDKASTNVVGGTEERSKRSLSRKTDRRTLDELLNGPVPSPPSARNRKMPYTPNNGDKRKGKTHRRTQSEPFIMEKLQNRMGVVGDNHPLTSTSSSSSSSAANRARLLSSSSSSSGTNGKGHRRTPSFKLVESYGEIDQEQPSLMDQARQRAASAACLDWHMA